MFIGMPGFTGKKGDAGIHGVPGQAGPIGERGSPGLPGLPGFLKLFLLCTTVIINLLFIKPYFVTLDSSLFTLATFFFFFNFKYLTA